MISIFIFASVLFGMLIFYNIHRYNKRKQLLSLSFPDKWHTILLDKVQYYARLNEKNRIRFQEKIRRFITDVPITGVKEVQVDDTLKLLVASSAIIPVFLFDEWEYVNLTQVLVYDGLVETNQANDPELNVILLGQVRPFQNKHLLLLSRQYLEHGFKEMNDASNVGFHEFAHLIDQLDGTMDGIPKVLMPESLLKPWTELMYTEIQRIENNHSDINPYALTNHAEFFAVVSEYFFENPERFKENHAGLYAIMDETFRRKE